MGFAKRSQSSNSVFETVLTPSFGKISPAAKFGSAGHRKKNEFKRERGRRNSLERTGERLATFGGTNPVSSSDDPHPGTAMGCSSRAPTELAD
jgi:hypothetical protein